jgi:hypothetical protein
VGVGTGSGIFVPATNIGIVLRGDAPQLGLTVAVGPTLADGPLVGNQQILSGLGEPLVASATFAVSPAPTGETFSGTAKATGAFGGLGVSAKDTYSCPGVANCNPGSASDVAFAYATFTDLLTIPPLAVGCPSLLGCGPGAPGTLLLSFDVSGVASGAHLPFNGGGNANLDVAVNIGGKLFESGCAGFTTAVPLTTITCPDPLPFSFGSSFALSVGFAAATDAGPFGTSSAVADFIDTAILSGIQVFDGEGNAVTGWTIASASGVSYGPNGVGGPPAGVPMPSTLVLLALGLTGLTGLGWYQGRRSWFRPSFRR